MRPLRLAAAAALILLTACSSRVSRNEAVVASSYPVWFIASEIAGDRLEVVDVIPAGIEPHDIELTPGDARTIAEARLVLYVGGGFQPAIEDAAEDARSVDLLTAASPLETGEGIDPHVWLDPGRMSDVTTAIAAELGEIDPDGAGTFAERRDRLIERLTELDRHFTEALRSCDRRSFITSHAAFTYLAERYDLEQIAVSGLSPEAEPQPARIAEVIELARTTGATTIFYEELVSPAVAEAIAEEADLRVAVLSPIESAPEDGDYLDAMEANLATLTDALACDP